MTPEIQAQLSQAIAQASAQLQELSGEAQGDTQVAIDVARRWLEELESGSVTSSAGEIAEELKDPAARAWMQGFMAQGQAALPHLQKLHALGREFAALGLADRQVRALRQQDPKAAVALGDAVLAWNCSVACGAQRATLEVTVGETALISAAPDGAERLRVALHSAHLRGHWRASFQGAIALSMAAEHGQQLARAVELAHTARAIAVEHKDPNRYLAAMQRLMHLAEMGGERAQAYEIALRAGASLEKLIGARGRAVREELLAGLELRWGEQAFGQVRAEFLAAKRP